MLSSIKKLVVCGAGTMGAGIAQVCAVAGFETVLFDLSDAVLESAQKKIEADLLKAVEKGKLDAGAKEAALQRLHNTSNINRCTGQVVIEAIVEKLQPKLDLFLQLHALNGNETIYCSNTSSLSINALAQQLPAPAQVAGLHFFNPAPLMKLVEVVKGTHTTPVVIDTLMAFTKALGKTPVLCTDSPGFIVNRVARPYYIEALRLAEAGYAMQEIDALLEGIGFKMGPFKLMDLIGNDVNYAVSQSVWEQLGTPERLRPSHLQQQKVAAGHLGKKTCQGYYKYK